MTKGIATSTLVKTLLVVIFFFTYNIICNSILTILGVQNEVITMFLADAIFLFFILILYGKKIIKDFKEYHKNNKISKRLKTILIGFVILFFINIGSGIILDTIFPNIPGDENTTALYSLDTLYTIFKVLIFSIIAEELVFRKAIGEVIDNKIAFVLISSIIYSLTLILYSDLTDITTWINVINYFAIYLTLSIVYVRHNKNIYPVMMMKFLLNIVPVAILLIRG